jgi:hypothetical protein
LKSFQNHFAMADFGRPFKNQMIDGQTSGPPKPLLNFVLSAYFSQLEVSIQVFDQNQTRWIIALWQRHGRTNNEIYNELEVMYHTMGNGGVQKEEKMYRTGEG